MSGVIGTLIGVIVTLVIVGVVWWAIQQLLPMLPVGEPFMTIIRVLLMVILVLIVLWVILVLLGAAGVHVGGPFRWGALTGGAIASISASAAPYLSRMLT